jgi:hypothetical protein
MTKKKTSKKPSVIRVIVNTDAHEEDKKQIMRDMVMDGYSFRLSSPIDDNKEKWIFERKLDNADNEGEDF